MSPAEILQAAVSRDGGAPLRVAPRRVPADPESALARRALTIARRTALGVLGDRAMADDVAQEVALVALRKAADVRDAQALDAWLHRVAVRAALKETRRAQRRRVIERQAAHPADVAAASPANDAIALLAPLPARQRAALTLRYAHDLDDAAIARALGCRPGTVGSLLSRGRSALRAALDAKDADR